MFDSLTYYYCKFTKKTPTKIQKNYLKNGRNYNDLGGKYTEKKMLLNQKHFFPKACLLLIHKNILQDQ